MPTAADLAGLAKTLHGGLIGPDDPGYDDARKVWNGLIDKRPAALARCADEADVATAIAFARRHGLPLAVRGGGHNVAGFGTCDGGLVIDLSPMKGITVDVAARTARAQGGLTWAEFDKATQQYGLATTGGLVSTTGVAGFTLGGGIGWLMRKHGLAIDNLLAVELVTADGKRVAADARTNPDLFWAVRGGGGNFGVVTSFTFQLHPVGPEILGGAVFYPVAQAADLLRFYRDWVGTLSDDTTTMAVFITAPPFPFIPAPIQGTPVVGIALCHAGPRDRGEAAIKALLEFGAPAAAHVGPAPYVMLQGMFDPGAPKGLLSYWKTEYLRDLGNDTIGVLTKHTAGMGAPFTQVHIHQVGGAVSRVDPDATAFGHRGAPFILNAVGLWQDPAETEKSIAWTRSFAQAMQPHSTGAQYLNFLADANDEKLKAAYGEKKLARLAKVKRQYDPENVFRINQNIRPAGAA
jgi:FAD/FMN-containing dehydrogenase